MPTLHPGRQTRRIIKRILLTIVVLPRRLGLVGDPHQADPVAVAGGRKRRGTVEKTVANTRAGTVKACRRAKLSPSAGGQIANLPVRRVMP